MRPERRALWGLSLAALDAAVLAALWHAAIPVREAMIAAWPFDLVPGAQRILRPVDPALASVASALVVPTWLLVLYRGGRYRHALRVPDVASLVRTSMLATIAVMALLYAVGLPPLSRTLLLAFACVAPVMLALDAITLRALIRRVRDAAEQIVLVGPAAALATAQASVAAHPEWGVHITQTVAFETTESISSIESLVRQLPTDGLRVVGLVPHDARLIALTKLCAELGMTLDVDVSDWPLRPHAVHTDGDRLVLRFEPTHGALALKRLLDVIGAAVILAVFTPIILSASALIILIDRASPIYRQTRAGHHGRPFTMYKLRTMRAHAHAQHDAMRALADGDAPAFKLTDDPRVTPLGRYLRRWSIDELPQLVNVVRGDMSLVGPRPPLPEEVARYDRRELRRLSMRPGLTCTWQVSGRSELDWDTWMALDLAYIDEWSLGRDIVLLIRTIPAVIGGRGAW